MPQKTKTTYDEVYAFVESKGCKLLSDSYVNMKQYLSVKCPCGITYEITFDSFKNKNRITCRTCSNKKISNSSKLDISDVKRYVESKGCKLITEVYIDAKSKMEFQCSCGNKFIRNFNKFKSGQIKCKSCVGRKEWNFDNVKSFIEIESNSGCKLITTDYINRKQKLEIQCNCGNHFITDFHSFLNSNKRNCYECTLNSLKDKNKKGIDYLKNYVRENSNSVLISDDYENYFDTLLFKCECGNNFETCFASFMNGKTKCNICSPNSKLEHNAELFFIQNNISYIPQYSFEDLLSPKNRKLKFDFGVLNNNGDLKFLLELDGQQHFQPFDGFGGEEKFQTMKIHDRIKDEYCKSKGITLYRISYKELNNLNNVLSNISL